MKYFANTNDMNTHGQTQQLHLWQLVIKRCQNFPLAKNKKTSRKSICIHVMLSHCVEVFLFQALIFCSTSALLLPLSGWWTGENRLRSATLTSTGMLARWAASPTPSTSRKWICTNQLQAAKQPGQIPSFIVITNIDIVIIVLSVHNKSGFDKRGLGGVMRVQTV